MARNSRVVDSSFRKSNARRSFRNIHRGATCAALEIAGSLPPIATLDAVTLMAAAVIVINR